MNNNNELPNDIKDCIKKIEECCYNIAIKNNNIKNLQKISFLDKEGFYNNKDNKYYKK
jgi:hypothetical protein